MYISVMPFKAVLKFFDKPIRSMLHGIVRERTTEIPVRCKQLVGLINCHCNLRIDIMQQHRENIPKGDLHNVKYVKNGLIYIFSHDEFQGYKQRKGRVIDEERIRKHFSRRNFKVLDPFVNLTDSEVNKTLKGVASTNFDDYDCILVFVITQYDNFGKYLAKIGSYTEDEITQWFKGSTTPSLVLKPKLFFFQASKAIPSLKKSTLNQTSIATDHGKDEPLLYSLPGEANLFIVRSSLSYISNGGTWFIQKVCQHLKGRMPLHDEIVNVSLSAKKKCCGFATIPDVTSTLIYKLYLGDTKGNTNQSLEAYERREKNGCVFIFNYDGDEGCSKTRKGTEYDCTKMEETFDRLDFDVFIKPNQKRRDVLQEFVNSKDIFSLYACIIVAVFTHGSNGMLGTADGDLDPTYLFDAVEPYFKGKPKIFIFQVCRGDIISESVSVEGSVENKKKESDEEDDLKTDAKGLYQPAGLTNTNPVLKMVDTLVLHSTSSGRTALRDTTKGTWFIQALCAEIDEQTKNMRSAPLLDIFIWVQQKVALKKYWKQMPVYTSTLTRKIVIGKNKTFTMNINWWFVFMFFAGIILMYLCCNFEFIGVH